MASQALTFSIGSVTLNDPFEFPNGLGEGINDFGSKLKHRFFEFAGGTITAQTYGKFPKPLIWKGLLRRNTALSRNAQFEALVDAGPVSVSYADWSVLGLVVDYKSNPKNQNEIEYTITFKPLVSNTNTSAPPVAPSFNSSGTLANAQNTMNQQATSPASGSALPSPITQSVLNFNGNLNQTLQQFNGNLQNIPASSFQSLQQQVQGIQSQLQSLINGSDPSMASAAADLNGTLGILSAIFNNGALGNSTLAELRDIINPDIYQLASQFYKDPTKYDQIMKANSALDDVYPIGSFDIVIPVDQTSTLTQPPTVMTDGLS